MRSSYVFAVCPTKKLNKQSCCHDACDVISMIKWRSIIFSRTHLQNIVIYKWIHITSTFCLLMHWLNYYLGNVPQLSIYFAHMHMSHIYYKKNIDFDLESSSDFREMAKKLPNLGHADGRGILCFFSLSLIWFFQPPFALGFSGLGVSCHLHTVTICLENTFQVHLLRLLGTQTIYTVWDNTENKTCQCASLSSLAAPMVYTLYQPTVPSAWSVTTKLAITEMYDSYHDKSIFDAYASLCTNKTSKLLFKSYSFSDVRIGTCSANYALFT